MKDGCMPKVAIVEDDPILSFLYREVCKAAGWHIVGEASSVSLALQLLCGDQPDLLLLDYSLEGQHDGLELLREVADRWPQVYTTLVTGWDIEALAARIDYIEADSVLKKPITPALLAAHLDARKAACQPAVSFDERALWVA